MGRAPSPSPIPIPPQSAIHSLIASHPGPTSIPHQPHLHTLAVQVAHNLRYQHGWSDVLVHYTSPVTSRQTKRRPLPRPLVSGLPPQRLYIHPDEQIALLQEQKQRQQDGKFREGETEGKLDVRPEREWVLPTQLREKWSLRGFGEVFDAIGIVPPSDRDGDSEGILALFEDGRSEQNTQNESAAEAENKWRTTKRVLLATLDDDSTVVYYIVHDGIVKPRQN